MFDSFSPDSALSAPLLWLVHTGPEAGQALPLQPGILGRISGLTDPSISRQQLRLTAEGSRLRISPLGATNPTYRFRALPRVIYHFLVRFTPCFSRYHSRHRLVLSALRVTRLTQARWLRRGDWLRLGQTTLQACPRPRNLRVPPPPPPSRIGNRWWLILLLPLALALGTGRFLGLRVLFILAAAAIIGAAILTRRARDVPTPHQLWLSAATPPPTLHQRADSLRVYSGKKFHSRILDIPAGQSICFTGPAGSAFARWVIAQALLYGQASFDNLQRENTLEIRLFTETDTAHWNSPLIAPHEIVICTSAKIAPPWVTRVHEVPHTPCSTTPAWFTTLFRALQHHPRELAVLPPNSDPQLPATVSIEAWGSLAATQIRNNWAAASPGLRTNLGLCLSKYCLPSTQAPVEIKKDRSANPQTWELDLLKEGPHALVAGTSGSGKSELLTTWLLGLATQYPPTHLQFILVDYKGGAAFGPLTQLPHTHGVLTDLDPLLTKRAIQSLAAFLKQREATLAAAGARDLEHHHRVTGKVLPRIVVVVDEFRSLATEHRELMENLIRLATHGRSLGLHLILATQKPGGIVNTQIMANMNLRICLRVQSATDSAEVLADGRAAELPALPGRLYWEGTTSGLAQVAWCGTGTQVEDLVESIRQANAQQEQTLPRIWLPPLPKSVSAAPNMLALADFPQEARQTWLAPEGTLGIFGNPGTGRTTTLLTLATIALSRGPVYVFSPQIESFRQLRGDLKSDADDCRTIVETDQGWPGALLSPAEKWGLERLATAAAAGELRGATLLLDRADILEEIWESITPGSGAKTLEELIAGASNGKYSLSFSAPLSAGRHRWANQCASRLVLGARDTADLYTGGIENILPNRQPSELLSPGAGPGRGVWSQAGNAAVVQIGLPTPTAIIPIKNPACSAVTTAATPLSTRSDSTSTTKDSGLSAESLQNLVAKTWHIPRSFTAQELPQPQNQVCLGWSTSRAGWLRYAPRRHWIVDDVAKLRPVVAQLKREYRRLGYQTITPECLPNEHKGGAFLILTYDSPQKHPNLRNFWEQLEKTQHIDLTILELRSPAVLPLTFPEHSPGFRICQTTLVCVEANLESRHRAANVLKTTPDFVRKTQATTDLEVMYGDEDECGALLPPTMNVTHLTAF